MSEATTTRGEASSRRHYSVDRDRMRSIAYSVVGLLLVYAGLSKVYPPVATPIGRFVVLPAIVTASVGLGAAVLGCILLSGYRARFLWATLLATFCGYLAVLGIMRCTGQTQCSCIPGLELPVVRMGVLDLLVIAGIVFDRAFWFGARNSNVVLTSFPGVGMAVFALAAGIACVVLFGSVNAAVAYCNGAAVIPEKPSVHIGRLKPGENKPVRFRLHSFYSQPLTIVGAYSSCSCVAIEDLPLTIAPFGSADLTVHVLGLTQDAGTLRRFTAELKCNVNVPTVRLTTTAVVDGGTDVRVSFEKEGWNHERENSSSHRIGWGVYPCANVALGPCHRAN